MSDLDGGVDVGYINREHLDVADRVFRAGSGVPTYDDHDYTDRYYKSGDWEKKRIFEDVRQLVSGIEEGVSQSEQGKSDLLKKFVGLAGYYVQNYGSMSMTPEIVEIIDKLNQKLNISLENSDYISGLVFEQAKYLESNVNYEIFQERKSRAVLAIEKLREFCSKDLSQHSSTEMVDILINLGDRCYEGDVYKEVPELAGQIEWFDQQKDHIFMWLKSSFSEDPSIFNLMENDRIRFLLLKDGQTSSDQELLKAFVTSSSTEKLIDYLNFEFNLFGMEGFSEIIFSENDLVIENLTEKREELSKFLFEKFRTIREQDVEQNIVVYKGLIGFFSFLVREKPWKLDLAVDQLTVRLPDKIYFWMRHFYQMENFSIFLGGLFLDTLHKSDVKPGTIETFVSFLDFGDLRYDDINKKFESVVSKINKKWGVGK